MFRFISLFVDFVIWCSETKRFKILFWTCWLKKEKKSWPLTSKSFCGAYTEQKSELLCFSKELLRAFGKIWSRCLPLPAPAGADKRGLGAPFPLVENAGIQPAIPKRVPAGAPAGAGFYWKHWILIQITPNAAETHEVRTLLPLICWVYFSFLGHHCKNSFSYLCQWFLVNISFKTIE